jgi:hypothetical protein
MAVNKQYVADLVAEMNEARAKREAEEMGKQPVIVVYGVGINYEGSYRYFAKREDAEAFKIADKADYIEEIRIY